MKEIKNEKQSYKKEIYDIVFPKDNEEDFLKIAKQLKINKIYFCYNLSNNIKEKKQKLKELSFKNNIELKVSIIAEDKDIQKARNFSDVIIYQSSQRDQSILERGKINIIFNLENSYRKDKTHYRFSKYNQVLAKLCANKNISLGISFKNILEESNNKKRAVKLGRIIQNIRIAKKYNVDIFLGSFAKKPKEMRSLKDLKSLIKVLAVTNHV